ncbi:MAG: nucleotide exchange factor GrpE [Proteobacteria bacterium]|nr:nucleotide exchange factor GrpE [Pseudomonadota bacterium]MCH8177224.1 nucleotide exchange factor GrpE [Pseudomonadota bacterium]
MSSEQDQIEENEKDVIAEPDKVVDETPGKNSAESDSEKEAEKAEDNIELELEKAQEKIKDYWDQILRLKAEIENNRKRAERDIESAHKYALKNFVEALLPIIDSMEMSQAAADAENASLESFSEGVDLTMNMFIQMLEKQGLVQLDPQGEKFDPEQHQAISMKKDKKAKSNTVIEVMQKGFLLNDRLVRPAMVIVAK